MEYQGWNENPTGPRPQLSVLRVWMTLHSEPLRMCHPPSLHGSPCWHLAQQVTPGGMGGMGVQAVCPGPTPTSEKAIGPSAGPPPCHTLAFHKNSQGWCRLGASPCGSQVGVRDMQAKCKLSLKVSFYLQHPNDFCSALHAFLYFNNKTDFFVF